MLYGIQGHSEARLRPLRLKAKVLVDSGMPDGFQESCNLGINTGIAVGFYEAGLLLASENLQILTSLIQNGEAADAGGQYYLDVDPRQVSTLKIYQLIFSQSL